MAPLRPAMQARDSSGNHVSLLNYEEEPPAQYYESPVTSYEVFDMARSASVNTAASRSSYGSPPALVRDSSYDSQGHGYSPITPALDYQPQPSYMARTVYPPMPFIETQEQHLERSPYSYPELSASQYPPAPLYPYAHPQEESHQTALPDSTQGEDPLRTHPFKNAPSSTRHSTVTKKYPCRYAEQHQCTRTFTTSGHASRHAKIHVLEKNIKCTFPDCQKSFTRGDNMKQHLQTHYKDKSRSKSRLARPAGVQKSGRPSSSSSNISHDNLERSMAATVEVKAQAGPLTHRPRLNSASALDILASAAQHNR